MIGADIRSWREHCAQSGGKSADGEEDGEDEPAPWVWLEVRMNDKVGIWIDHRTAVIVSASADRVTVRTLESQVGPHTRYSGRAGSPAPEGGQDEGGEKRYEKRNRQHLDRYYDAVISPLGHPEALLILGPIRRSS